MPEVAIPVAAVAPLVVTSVEPVVGPVLEGHTVAVVVVVVAAVGAVVASAVIVSAPLMFAWTFVASTAVGLLLEQVAHR